VWKSRAGLKSLAELNLFFRQLAWNIARRITRFFRYTARWAHAGFGLETALGTVFNARGPSALECYRQPPWLNSGGEKWLDVTIGLEG
jgi:hypothetical protein